MALENLGFHIYDDLVVRLLTRREDVAFLVRSDCSGPAPWDCSFEIALFVGDGIAGQSEHRDAGDACRAGDFVFEHQGSVVVVGLVCADFQVPPLGRIELITFFDRLYCAGPALWD